MRSPGAPTPQDRRIALPGSLHPDAAEDVRLFRQILSWRDKFAAELYGVAMRPSILRQEVQRLVILEFSAGRTNSVAYYQRQCIHLNTPPTVRAQIRFLEETGCVVTARADTNRKSLLVYPTRKLIEFYNQKMPIFRRMISQSFRDRENPSNSNG